MRNGRITDPAAGDPANGALMRPAGPVNQPQGRDVNPLGGSCYQQLPRKERDMYAAGFNEPSVNGGVQQGLILRWNGSTGPAGTSGPLYGGGNAAGRHQ